MMARNSKHYVGILVTQGTTVLHLFFFYLLPYPCLHALCTCCSYEGGSSVLKLLVLKDFTLCIMLLLQVLHNAIRMSS